MVPIFRFLMAAIVANGAINGLLLNFVFDSPIIPLLTAIWFALGYARIFGRRMMANSFKDAFRGVFMALLWPAIPAKR